VLSERTVVEC